MTTCQHCGREIKHRRLGESANRQVWLRWCVDPEDKQALPTYVCAGHRIGTGWYIDRYHEPAEEEPEEERTPAARLMDAVIAVAAAAPARPGTNVFAAKISWRKITELRDALDAMGVEWRP